MKTHSVQRGRTADGGPNPVDSHIGGRIRLRRLLAGLSQEQLAEAVGLTFQQVQKYERGGNRIAGSRLFDLSRALDVPVSFFFDDMDAATAAASPAALALGAVASPAPPPETPDRMELEAAKAFRAIAAPRHRRHALDVLRLLVRLEREAGLAVEPQAAALRRPRAPEARP